MFQEPNNYIEDDHFFFQSGQDLELVCNAPKDKEGVFKVVELRKGKVTLVFIGYSNSGGLFNEIVNGHHFDMNPRKFAWSYQLLKDQTDAIDVYWYVTDPIEMPKKIFADMLKVYIKQTGRLPKWNK